jgi:hypothetical protein
MLFYCPQKTLTYTDKNGRQGSSGDPEKTVSGQTEKKTCLSSESCDSHLTVFIRQGFCSLEFHTNGLFKRVLF